MIEADNTAIEEKIETAIASLDRIKHEISKTIYGQQQVVEESLITLLAGGHALLVGVPGLAKTKLAETLGIVLGLSQKRVQFTPDLMPGDILGSEVLDETADGQRKFRFVKGPIFAQLLMADEINRASPRTQAALLQAMQERRVTVAGVDHTLPLPFHVLATQNPIEHEGTYPLPEAQLDRFLMQINVDYPDIEAERQIVVDTTGASETIPEQVIDGDQLKELQHLVRLLPVGDKIVDAILAIVRAGRPENGDSDGPTKHVSWGPGPRAGQALMLVVRVKALLDGRLAPSLDDVRELATPVLRHRMAITFQSRYEGITVDGIIGELTGRYAS